MTDANTGLPDTPDTPEEAVEALIDTIGEMTLAQVADTLGRLTSRLDELVLDEEIAEEPK